MKKKANYIILFSLIVFLSGCGNHISQKMEEMKKEKTSQTDTKPKVTKHEKKTGKIINQPIENYSGNTLTMLDWVVMPPKMGSNEEDKANFVFYYTIDKTVSEKLNPPSEFFSVFRIFQDGKELPVANYSSQNSVHDAFSTKTDSPFDNSGLKKIYVKQGIYLSNDQSPVTVKSKITNLEYEQTFNIKESDHLFKVEEAIDDKPTESEILDIYASQGVGNINRSMLSVKQKNEDGSVDISIDTANGYVHSYFEGDYLIFEMKSFENVELHLQTKYNYKNGIVEKNE